jgi:hypothetical protein
MSKTYQHIVTVDEKINEAVEKYQAAYKLRYKKLISKKSVLVIMINDGLYKTGVSAEKLVEEHNNYHSNEQ